jgi:hypothetical protein
MIPPTTAEMIHPTLLPSGVELHLTLSISSACELGGGGGVLLSRLCQIDEGGSGAGG